MLRSGQKEEKGISQALTVCFFKTKMDFQKRIKKEFLQGNAIPKMTGKDRVL
jgi:hypothetical protein